jgi:hypothetical protein
VCLVQLDSDVSRAERRKGWHYIRGFKLYVSRCSDETGHGCNFSEDVVACIAK